MNASIYLAFICMNKRVESLSEDILEFFSQERILIKGEKVLLRSAQTQVEYDDLGTAVFDYISRLSVPDLESLSSEDTAYVQVVPVAMTDPIRVYLASDLINLLAKKNLGLDIHPQ